MMERVTQRRAGSEDALLLYELFSTSRAVEFAAMGLTGEQYRPLLEMQYRGRAMTCAAQYPEAEDWIVCMEYGTAVGNYLLAGTSAGPRMIDLAVLPQWRGKGIGTQVLRQAAHRSAAAGEILSLRVMKGNQAMRLYTRVGFQVASEDETSCEMIWQPPPERPKTADICRAS